MNIISLNCRGTQNKGFSNLIRDIKKECKASLMCLLETHSSGLVAKKIFNGCNYDKVFIQDAVGEAGGIWILWDSMIWDIEILAYETHYVHLKVRNGTSPSWFMTVVYGSPHYQAISRLMDSLINLVDSISHPWVVVGDFNSILNPHDRDKHFCNYY